MHVSKTKHLLCLTGIALLLMTVGSMTSFLFPLHTGVAARVLVLDFVFL